MTPEQLQKLNEVYDFVQSLKASATIPYEVDGAFRERFKELLALPSGLEDAPLSAITSPSGGVTVDSQARTAIDTIITRLEDLGLVVNN